MINPEFSDPTSIENSDPVHSEMGQVLGLVDDLTQAYDLDPRKARALRAFSTYEFLKGDIIRDFSAPHPPPAVYYPIDDHREGETEVQHILKVTKEEYPLFVQLLSETSLRVYADELREEDRTKSAVLEVQNLLRNIFA